jgi:hypothetical protein
VNLKSRNYHRRLNRILNAAVRRAERRDGQFYANPSASTGRAKREALLTAHTLLDMAHECDEHYTFSIND